MKSDKCQGWSKDEDTNFWQYKSQVTRRVELSFTKDIARIQLWAGQNRFFEKSETTLKYRTLLTVLIKLWCFALFYFIFFYGMGVFTLSE